MSLLKHWEYVMFGVFADSSEFKSPDTGEMQRFLRFDYFGGQQSLPVDSEADFHALLNILQRGRQCRIYGDLLIKNGHARPSIQRYEIEGVTEKFKQLTEAEELYGSMFSGLGEVLEKKFYSRQSDGSQHYSVLVRAPGSPVSLAVLNTALWSHIPATGLHTFEGKLLTEIQSGYSKQTGRTEKSIVNFEYGKCSPYTFGSAKSKEPA